MNCQAEARSRICSSEKTPLRRRLAGNLSERYIAQQCRQDAGATETIASTNFNFLNNKSPVLFSHVLRGLQFPCYFAFRGIRTENSASILMKTTNPDR